MVGFKISTLAAFIMASMALISCVPQAKQTECGPNEAFSATQRKCLPVNPSETSFIKIKAPVPTAGITQEAESGSQLTFSVMIDNPYNKPYRIQWIRNFNGAQHIIETPSNPSANIADHPYSIKLIPSNHLFGAIGSHIITAQVLEATNNNIIDSHDFSLTLIDRPTPNGQSFSPSLTVPLTYNANHNANINFSFSVLRNNRSLELPRVIWTLTKLTGETATRQESVAFSNNINSPQMVYFTFNPANPFDELPINAPVAPYKDTVGNYKLEALIKDNGTGESFGSYTWDITIKHPDLGQIVEASHPTPRMGEAYAIKAFNNISYDDLTPSNFSYVDYETETDVRGQFCVKVSDPDGRYGSGVRVAFYLENDTAPVYENNTTSLSRDTICLDDVENTLKNSIMFRSSNPELTWSTFIRAKVIDDLTEEEYKNPITWNVVVGPTNKAPVLTFSNLDGLNCPLGIDGSGSVKRGCQVTQDNLAPDSNNSFTVTFNVKDDHYTGSYLASNTTVVANLFRGSASYGPGNCAPIATGDIVTYSCQFAVPAANDSGPVSSLSLVNNQWRIAVQVTDPGSPYDLPGTNQKHSFIYWDLDVTEINTPSTAEVYISLNEAPYTDMGAHLPGRKVKETDTIVFNIRNYQDFERDSYSVEVEKCQLSSEEGAAADTCLNPSPVTNTPLITYLTSDWGTNRRAVFTIPDGFIDDIDVNTTKTIRFKVTIKDHAETIAANIIPYVMELRIQNHNPAPVFADVDALGEHTVFATVPLRLDPGDITDDSIYTYSRPDNLESTILYRWSIRSTSTGPWITINGADQMDGRRILTWTPGPEVNSGLYYIRLCVTDNSPNRAPICNNPATINVVNNFSLSSPIDRIMTNEEMWGSPAIWMDDTSTTTSLALPNAKTIYAAFAVKDRSGIGNINIRVVKYLLNSDNDGALEKLNEITFPAINPRTIDQPNTSDVQDISIVGDDHSLYIAYMARYDSSDSYDEGGRPEVRRIRKDFYTLGERTNGPHPAPFAFSYDGFFIRSNCAACLLPPLPYDQVANGEVKFDFDAIDVNDFPVTLELSQILFADADPDPVTGDIVTLTINDPWTHATDLADQINNSIDPRLQGYSAHIDGTNLVIRGPLSNDELTVNQIALKVGKLNISNGKVFLPFINASTAAPQAATVSVISFTSDQEKKISSPEDYTIANLMDTHALDVDNTVDRHGNVLIAYVSTTDTGKGKLVVLPGGNIPEAITSQDIITTGALNKIRISGNNSDNAHYFALGRSGSHNLHASRFALLADFSAVDLTSRQDWLVTAADGVADFKTFTTFNSFDNIWDFSISSAYKDSLSSVSHQARILIASDRGIFAFNTLGDNTVTCGECLPIGKEGIEQPENSTTPPLVVDFNKRLGVSQIVPNVLIGSPGNAGGLENNASMMSFAYIGEDIDLNPGEQRLYMGVINTNRTSVNSTNNHASGLWGVSIFKK